MAANILIVEDEPAIQELLALNLSQAGHNPIRALSVEQAQMLMRDALPDLIILDWMLPGMSGIEFARKIKAVLRRRAPQMTDDPIESHGLRLDPTTHRVTGNKKTIELGPTEFKLLHYLMSNPERVHSRSQVLDRVWGDKVFVEDRTVDVHIRRLRLALEQTGHEDLIQTVRGVGYRFSAQ